MKKETEVVETALVEVPETFKSQVAIFNDLKAFVALLDACRAKAAEAGTDVSTAKSRDAIKAVAFKIRKVGVVVDEAGAKLAEDMRKQVGAIDKNRREYKGDIVALAVEVRKPVTDYEAEEEARVTKIRETMREISDLGVVPFGSTVQQIQNRIRDLDDIVINETFGDMQEQAEDRAKAATALLDQALIHAQESARQAEENERLRAEKAAADKAAAEERAAREAIEAQKEAVAREAERQANAEREKEFAAQNAAAAAQQAEIDRLRNIAAEAQKRADEAESREKEAKRAEQMLKDRRELEDKAEKENAARIKAAKAKAESERTKRRSDAIEAANEFVNDIAITSKLVDAIIDGKIPFLRFGVGE